MSLRLDWATHEAAKFACENWHYSRCLPGAKKMVCVGVWEENKYVGVIIFSPGASSTLGAPYGLNQFECTELVRVALSKHRSQVSKIIAISLKMIKKRSPGIKLVVSFADPYRGHHGGIYQAGNWIYTGKSAQTWVYEHNGKIIHQRTLDASGFKGGRKKSAPVGAKKILMPGKHRYLMPIDETMKKKISSLSKPYPKRVGSKDNVASGFQSEEGGATPTPTLQNA